MFNLKKYYWAFIIYNQPYPWVDLFYSSVEDLNLVVDMLNQYMLKTNNPPTLYYPPIAFWIDEAHNYFFSRNFTKNFDDRKRVLFTQPRKRNILIPVVSQRFSFLDINIRRLLFEIISPRRFFFWSYIREVEVLDIENPNLWVDEYEGITWQYVNNIFYDFFENWRLLLSDFIPVDISSYKYLTNYVIGDKSYLDVSKIDYFLDYLLERNFSFQKEILKKNEKELKKLDLSISPLELNNWIIKQKDLKNE